MQVLEGYGENRVLNKKNYCYIVVKFCHANISVCMTIVYANFSKDLHEDTSRTVEQEKG